MSEFTEWYPWDRRDEIPGADQRGVYVIAHFTEPPSGPADPAVVEIAYIGETHGKTRNFSKRFGDFDKAARVGGGTHKHSGGNTYYNKIGGALTGAYVAVMPIDGDARTLKTTILGVERQVIQTYVDRWHRLPVCNTE